MDTINQPVQSKAGKLSWSNMALKRCTIIIIIIIIIIRSHHLSASRPVCHGALCWVNCCSQCTCHQPETLQRRPTVCVIAEAALTGSLILTHSVRMYLFIHLSVCLSVCVSPHNILFPDPEAKRLGRFRWNFGGNTAQALAVFLKRKDLPQQQATNLQNAYNTCQTLGFLFSH